MSPNKPAKNAAAQTPCDRGDDLMPIPPIHVGQGDAVALDFFYCFTGGNMIVKLDDTVLPNQVPAPDTIHIDLPPLSSGSHILAWLFHPVNVLWKATSELSVNGAVVRRRAEDNNSSALHLVLDFAPLEAQ